MPGACFGGIRIAATVVVVACLVGCAARSNPGVTRMVDGRVQRGPYVAPATYEAFVRAELAREAGQLDEAEALYREARRGSPEDPLVRARLAEVLALRGEVDAADETLDAALALDPDSEAAWLARARIAELRGATEEALDGYVHALGLAPESLEPTVGLARLLAAQGAPGRAASLLLERAEAPGAAAAGAARAALTLALVRGDGLHAGRAARALVRIAPARRAEVLEAARAALERGHPTLAAQVLDGLPEARDDATLRARAYLATGRVDDARAALVRASDGDPATAAARARLALEPETMALFDEVSALPADAARVEAAWLAGREALAAGRDEDGALHLAAVPEGTRFHEPARADLARALEAAGLGALACELMRAGRGEAAELACDGRAGSQ